ncbi:MAG: phosphoribosylamine--glycine ligase [candidate division KSB1 bacterium]|nr:phosphoribosylamine--glycine ligase [candidate division KSB1 bacterium]
MNILVIGGGGREHTLVWKIAQSPVVNKIYCAPGNAGIAQLAECVSINESAIDELLNFADRKRIDLAIIEPDALFAAGIVDAFQRQGLAIFGPTKKAAEIESSKIFAKYLMEKYQIPTAQYRAFDQFEAAKNYLNSMPTPIVIKADGLAAGKGAIVCFNQEEAQEALHKMMIQGVFGSAGKKVVIEEYLRGQEASVLAVTDGENLIELLPAQDHKPIFDDDKGPNTGGMGAYAPAVQVDMDMLQQIRQRILEPAIKGMALEDRPYRGVLYAGLMITRQGPKVIEFNCRFGDPETQVILPLVEGDIVPLLYGCSQGKLEQQTINFKNKFAVCVVMASGGYPGKYEKGKEIIGLERNFGTDVIIFHAGTKLANGKILTNGGRVLGITALGNDVAEAIKRAYKAVGKITFDGAYYRKDIGYKAL